MDRPEGDVPAGRRRVTGLVLLVGVAVVALLARSPATISDPAPDPDPAPNPGAVPGPSPTATPSRSASPSTPPPVPAGPQGAHVMLGLDEVLPVIDGTWAESAAMANGMPVQAGPFQVDTVWQPWATPEVVVLAGTDAGAYDPAADRWRALPSLPAAVDARSPRQVVSAGGGVYVAVGADQPDPALDVEPSGWLLDGPGWQPAPVVAGRIVGTCCEGLVVVVHASTSPEDIVQGSALSLVEPRSEVVTRLPDLPTPVVVGSAIAVPLGLVVFGHHLDGADRGTLQRPAALRWSMADDTWTVLPDPPARPGDATWVGGGPEGSDGRVVAISLAQEPTHLTFITLDLDRAQWADDVPVPLDDRGLRRTGAGGLAVAWDGERTLWAYGGYAASVHLAHDLPTGDLAVARPTLGRTGAALVWHEGRLVLFGGWGTGGQSTTVGVWQPSSPP